MDYTNLDINILEKIFSCMDGRTFATSRAVCKPWFLIGNFPEVRKYRLICQWGLKKVTGDCRKSSFLEAATFSSLVFEHKLTDLDSLAGLAVKYNIPMPTLKRINCLYSDWSINSRRSLYIPVASILHEEELQGRTLAITYFEDAKREILVLLPTQEKHSSKPSSFEIEIEPLANDTGKVGQTETSRRALALSVSKELYIDFSAAFFYLSEADWNTRKAKQQFMADAHFVQGKRIQN